MRYILSCCALILLVPIAQAQTRWVTDELSIMMRSGESSKHKILRPLLSGTELTVISSSEETGYSLVSTEGGQEGYVLSRFLVAEPIAKNKLAAALAQIVQLTASSEPAQLRLQQSLDKINTLETTLRSTKAKNATLSAELEHIKTISADAININRQLQVVLERNQILENELNLERAENERLADRSNKEWFINGALAVLLGVVITLLVPKLRRPKRHSEWV